MTDSCQSGSYECLHKQCQFNPKNHIQDLLYVLWLRFYVHNLKQSKIILCEGGTAEQHLQHQITHKHHLDGWKRDLMGGKKPIGDIIQKEFCIYVNSLLKWTFERHHTLKTSNSPKRYPIKSDAVRWAPAVLIIHMKQYIMIRDALFLLLWQNRLC